MRIKLYFLFVCFPLLSSCVKSQDRIEINVPTAEEEAEYIWRTIIDTQFFEDNGYQVSLPKGELIDQLKMKAKANQLSDQDQEQLLLFVKENVYVESDYEAGKFKILAEKSLINKMINALTSLPFHWNFKKFDNYQVNLTLYGPGGSFNPDEGSILIYTTPDGRFKQYDNPANTILHEIVHIGIEKSIVVNYNVPHPFKERIVDVVVSLIFKDSLPDYRIQDMGDYRIDLYLKEKEDILYLNSLVEKAMSKNIE